MDTNGRIEQAIDDALIIQGWKTAPADYDWDLMDPVDQTKPVTFDFATAMRLMEEAAVRQRRQNLRVVHDAADGEPSDIAADCQRWAARKGNCLSPETIERMRRARAKAQGLTEPPENGDGR